MRRTAILGCSAWLLAFAATGISVGRAAEPVSQVQVCRTGRADLRVEACTKALEQTKEKAVRASLLRARGRAYARLVAHAMAFKDFDAALALEPESRDARYGRSLALHERNQGTKAADDIEKLVKDDSRDMEARILLARHRGAAKQIKEAAKTIAEALAIDPNNANIYRARADNFTDAGDNEKALADFDKAVKLAPQDAQLLVLRAYTRNRLRQDEAALKDYDAALKLDPFQVEAMYLKGLTLIYLGKKPEGMKLLDDAISLSPFYALPLESRADKRRLDLQFDEAMSDISRALELEPDHFNSYLIRGRIFAETDRPQEAIRDFTRVVENDPKNGEAYFERGRALAASKEHARAVLDFTEALRWQSDWGRLTQYAGPYIERAKSLRALGKGDDALADLAQAIKVEPKAVNAFYEIFANQADKKNWPAAVEAMNSVILLSEPKRDFLYLDRAVAHTNMGNCSEALADYDRALAITPGSASTLFAKVTCLGRLARFQEALDTMNTVINLDPSIPFAFSSRAYYQRVLGHLEAAVADGDEASRRNPNDATAYSNRGATLQLMGHHDRAIIDLTEALRIDPAVTPAHAYRGLAFEAKGDTPRAQEDFMAVLTAPPNNYLSMPRAIAIAKEHLSPENAARLAAQKAPTPPLTLTALAVPDAMPSVAPVATAGPRVALVIGNGAYRNVDPLANPVRDAKLMTDVLRGQGFNVIEGYDLDADGLHRVVSRYGEAMVGASVTLLYYAGHAVQVAGRNYLIGIDGKLERPSALAVEAVAVDAIVADMETERRTNLVFLDACRSNPFAQRIARARGEPPKDGLAIVTPGVGTLVAFATAPDMTAIDGKGEHSPFTASLAKHIPAEDVEINTIVTRVRNDVVAATETQVPKHHSSLMGEFYFKRSATALATPATLVAATPEPDAKPVYFVGKDGLKWQAVEGAEKARLLANIALFDGRKLTPEGTVVAKRPLSFLPGYELTSINSFDLGKKTEDFYLVGAGEQLRLDGSNRQIYFATEKVGSITKENAGEYLTFFFQYVVGPYGPMSPAIDFTDIGWSAKPTEKELKAAEKGFKPFKVIKSADDEMVFQVVFVFKDTLYLTQAKVHIGKVDAERSAATFADRYKNDKFPGKITIIDHKAVAEKLPINAFHMTPGS